MKNHKTLKKLNLKKESISRLTDLDEIKGKGTVYTYTLGIYTRVGATCGLAKSCAGPQNDCFAAVTQTESPRDTFCFGENTFHPCNV